MLGLLCWDVGCGYGGISPWSGTTMLSSNSVTVLEWHKGFALMLFSYGSGEESPWKDATG